MTMVFKILDRNGNIANIIEADKDFARSLAEEIGGTYERIRSSTIREKEPLEILKDENKLLKAQIQAQQERSDFIEDCIAEMAMEVYKSVW